MPDDPTVNSPSTAQESNTADPLGPRRRPWSVWTLLLAPFLLPVRFFRWLRRRTLPAARGRVRLALYAEADRRCSNCAAFEPGGGAAWLEQEASPTFQQVAQYLTPRQMTQHDPDSRALDGGARAAWLDMGTCPIIGSLTHPDAPDCGRWR